MGMKTSAVALAFGLLSVGLLGAGPGGLDPVETRGTLPEELAEDETVEELIQRAVGFMVPFDHILKPPCGYTRRYEFLSVAKAEVDDPLSDSRAQGEMEFFIIKVRATGCGDTRIHNLYAFERHGPYHIMITTPGATLANLTVQLDVQRTLWATVQPKDQCADEAMISDSSVLQAPTATNPNWTEVWTAQTCGVRSKFRVNFTNGDSGVSYSILPMA
jgi:hypothetical protein